MSTHSRFANLGRAFKEGESELLNTVARLSVLYEDLRLEIGELQIVKADRDRSGEGGDDFRVLYFIRRALVTLVEFRRALTRARISSEFKEAERNLTALESGYIARSEIFFQKHGDRIKALRNEFGGHIEAAGVAFATRHLSNVVGRITWDASPDKWTMGLECHFAGDIVCGSIASKLQPTADVKAELNTALEMIAQAFNHAQAATCALVHAFLWDRFGV
jgi:hypothetical protein